MCAVVVNKGKLKEIYKIKLLWIAKKGFYLVSIVSWIHNAKIDFLL